MSKPHSSLRHFKTAKSLSGATWTRRLSRNSDVVRPSGPKRSRSLATASSYLMVVPFLQAGGRGEVAGRHEGLGRRDLRRQWLGPFRPVAPPEFPGGYRAGLLDLFLQVDHRLEQLLGPRRAAGDVHVHRDEA